MRVSKKITIPFISGKLVLSSSQSYELFNAKVMGYNLNSTKEGMNMEN